ncbi:MAG TPA: Fur family transcriptional regulator [Halanaerobiales bacterium]|nr:Fur family transcriptional regulator [Halanaerobiales bacterium]
MVDLANYKEKLIEKGIRCTEQRLAILKVLLEERKPLSVRDIFNDLKKKKQEIRLSTIYRNLNRFVNKGLVKKMELKPNKKEKYFELKDGNHHHHLICVNCGKIIPVDCPLKLFEKDLSSRTKYRILDHRIKLYGLCPKCQKRSDFTLKKGETESKIF